MGTSPKGVFFGGKQSARGYLCTRDSRAADDDFQDEHTDEHTDFQDEHTDELARSFPSPRQLGGRRCEGCSPGEEARARRVQRIRANSQPPDLRCSPSESDAVPNLTIRPNKRADRTSLVDVARGKPPLIALHWASTAGFRADAFADSEADDFAATRWRRTAESNARPKSSNNIHIRIRQRKDSKSITTVQGLSEHFDLKQIIKALKKVHPISRVSVQIIRSRRSETIAARRDVFTGAQHERHGPRGPRGRLRHSDAGTRSIALDRFQPIPAFGRAGVVE